MKLYARLSNEKGKVDGMGANEYLDIDITIGNEVLAALTIRETINGWGLFDKNDKALARLNQDLEEISRLEEELEEDEEWNSQ